jgi:Asp/Glu/hydantoin racemase
MSVTRVAPLVERDRIEVVVLDCGGLLTAAARTVAAIGQLNPAVGVVLVADEAEAGLLNLPVLAKWGPFEDIYAAIEQAERDRGRRSRLVG